MLDGKRYFANFPDEAAAVSELPDPARQVRASLARLAALEQELSRYLRNALPSERSS
jgi:hypothetical protein